MTTFLQLALWIAYNKAVLQPLMNNDGSKNGLVSLLLWSLLVEALIAILATVVIWRSVAAVVRWRRSRAVANVPTGRTA